MDIGSAFTFMFDDEEWVKKLAIGGGIAFAATILSSVVVGLVLFFPLFGYMLETIKSVRDGQTQLPEWTDFGGLFVKGLMFFLISLVYSVPILLIACIFGGIFALTGQADIDEGVLTAIMSCFYCLILIVGLLIGIVLPAGIIRYVQFETFGSAFQFGEIFNFIKNNIGNYIIAILLIFVAQLLAQFGVILCVVGVFFTFFWSMLVQANLYGQLAREVN